MPESEEVLQTAIERAHELDPALHGTRPTRWMLLVESEDEHAKTVSVMRSGPLTPWEALGLLRFATLQEEAALHAEDEADDHGH